MYPLDGKWSPWKLWRRLTASSIFNFRCVTMTWYCFLDSNLLDIGTLVQLHPIKTAVRFRNINTAVGLALIWHYNWFLKVEGRIKTEQKRSCAQTTRACLDPSSNLIFGISKSSMSHWKLHHCCDVSVCSATTICTFLHQG